MSIGNNIRNQRKELNLTQQDLAQRVHKSAQVISNWEREYTTITIEDLLALADALDTSILSLITGIKKDTNDYQAKHASISIDNLNIDKVAESIPDKRLRQLIQEYPRLDEKSKAIIDAIISLSKDDSN